MVDEEVVLLLGICGLGIFLTPLLLVLVLWSKVNRLRSDVDVLQMRLREQRAAAPPVAAVRETTSVPITDIEIVATPTAPVAPRPITLPTRPGAVPKPPERSESLVSPVSDQPVPAKEPFSLEELLAGKWLTWVAALALQRSRAQHSPCSATIAGSVRRSPGRPAASCTSHCLLRSVSITCWRLNRHSARWPS
jgi:hypothetical protein